ncbi:RHS repeat-associated core domain-containing protein [Pseudomonas sp. LARHCG127]
MENFIGNGANIQWESNGLDQLYKASRTYSYGSTAKHKMAGMVARTVQRTFNSFHLLTEESTTQGDCVQRVRTSYHTVDGTFEQQPAYFQLPKTVEKRWELISDVTQVRSETLATTYDNFGNLLQERQPNGITTDYEYYPVDGYVDDDGDVHCPADPHGFVRNLRCQTVHPAEGHEGQAPVLRTRYRYMELSPLDNSLAEDFLVVSHEALSQVEATAETTLQSTRRFYLDMTDKPLLHGRPDRQEETLYDNEGKGKTATVSWRYSQADGELGARTLHQTIETLTGYNGSHQVTTTRASRFNGEIVWREDFDGVKSSYRYDVLGRLLEERVALDTPVEAGRQFSYSLASTDGQQAEQVLTNVKGVKTRTLFDGGNRVVEEQRQRQGPSGSLVWRQTYTAVHDALGRQISETVYDWLDDTPLPLTSQLAYDDWGEVCRTTGPDGVAQVSERRFDNNRLVICTWQEHAERPDVHVQRSETHYNLFDSPDKVRRLDAQDNTAGSRDYVYDGYGQCIREIETLRNPQREALESLQRTTEYVYDAWGRVLRTVLPNGDSVERTFAEHSISELPTRLQVTPANSAHPSLVAGTQQFDDLERLTERTVGPRTERYRYEGGHVQIHQRITPGNQTLTYGYNLALSQQPSVIRLAEGPESTYEYDPLSAAITQAINDQGQRDYEYTLEGALASERWRSNGVDQKTFHATSLQGRQLRREDDGAAPTQYQYDTAGRLRHVSQGGADGLEAEFTYNFDGLLERSTTINRASDQRLVTELAYDEHGREIQRTLKVDGEADRVLSLVWQDDDQLRSRRLEKAGLVLLEEAFEYDTRNRLTRHRCVGEALPTDQYGNAMTEQVFRFDALDNIERRTTYFADGSTDSARFTYDEDDKCQLREVSHSHPAYPPSQAFDYDADGHQLNDGQGRRLRYDPLGRLLEVRSADDAASLINYRYDAHDQLVGVRHDGEPETLRFYEGFQLSYTLQNDVLTQFLYEGDRPLAQQTAHSTDQTLLLLTDTAHNVLGENRVDGLHETAYSAYGERREDNGLKGLLAFAGEVREALIGWYLLGRGYRAYDPGLMRFHSPDSFSPFGAGGLNPYGYCLGNPIAWRDPSGHRSQGITPYRDPYPGYQDPIPQPKKPGTGIAQWIGVGLAALFLVVSVVAMPWSAPATIGVTAFVAGWAGIGLQAAGLGLQVYGTVTENETLSAVGTAVGTVGGLLAGVGIAMARAAVAAKAAAEASAGFEPVLISVTKRGSTAGLNKNSISAATGITGRGSTSASGATGTARLSRTSTSTSTSTSGAAGSRGNNIRSNSADGRKSLPELISLWNIPRIDPKTPTGSITPPRSPTFPQ